METIKPMEKLPKFEDGKLYEIKVSRTVEVGPELMARPSSPKIVVAGQVARDLGDVVIWAKKV
ncbi:hypothetical protein [Bradyrhizobium valentinum]|uniref:Uncharacterized protein n=1 Tax=Bradyrhizobium valentinum TaxID=1518501 RepID=A0A0R3KUU4_9BRAD|nr:hypothetical protein [Bradyrhizobium valentinum]KRQ99281.1 hypothetical protein CP49_11840 [Bradyrhizobium valentinum]